MFLTLCVFTEGVKVRVKSPKRISNPKYYMFIGETRESTVLLCTYILSLVKDTDDSLYRYKMMFTSHSDHQLTIGCIVVSFRGGGVCHSMN